LLISIVCSTVSRSFLFLPPAGTYILPGGLATSRAIAPFEAEAIESHPYIRDAFGDKYQWEVRYSIH
jgi:hypothetical protein